MTRTNRQLMVIQIRNAVGALYLGALMGILAVIYTVMAFKPTKVCS